MGGWDNGVSPGCHWTCCGHDRVTTNVWKQNSFSRAQLSIFAMNSSLTLQPAEDLQVKVLQLFVITAAGLDLCMQKSAAGRGRWHQTWILSLMWRTERMKTLPLHSFTFYKLTLPLRPGETNTKIDILWQMLRLTGCVACVTEVPLSCHSRYQHDRNNIMITSRVLYKHNHTPHSTQPWQPGHRELDPVLAQGKIQTWF